MAMAPNERCEAYMKWKREMGKERGPQHGEEKRPKHRGDLIQEQQKGSNEQGGEALRLRHALDTNRREPADLSVRFTAGLFIYHSPRPAWPGVRKEY